MSFAAYVMALFLLFQDVKPLDKTTVERAESIIIVDATKIEYARRIPILELSKYYEEIFGKRRRGDKIFYCRDYREKDLPYILDGNNHSPTIAFVCGEEDAPEKIMKIGSKSALFYVQCKK